MEIDWGVVMDIAVVVAIIGVIGILIKAIISNKSMKSDLSNEHALGRVSEKGEHDALSKDIGNVKEVIVKDISNVSSDTKNIKEILIVSKMEEKARVEALSKDQIDIKKHVEGIRDIQRVLEEVNKQNKELLVQNEVLKQEIKNLKQEIIKYKENEEEYENER